jgi:hypothetical protein
MENVQMLLHMEPEAFWRQLRNVVEEVIKEKGSTSSLSSSGIKKISSKFLLKQNPS